MTPKPTYRLGDLQLQIMKVLWNAGAATVAEVQRGLADEPLAYTTVATMLRKMEDRQFVAHVQKGRQFVYEPLVTAEEVTRSMADDLVERLFAGSLADTVSHLLRTREVSRRELAELEELIEQHKARK
ncbi:MAG: BlaI/MecI/CopY family transcriptional regulator [Thermoguttaceae bacterium]|jgi:BlaI family penicillinase repressor